MKRTTSAADLKRMAALQQQNVRLGKESARLKDRDERAERKIDGLSARVVHWMKEAEKRGGRR